MFLRYKKISKKAVKLHSFLQCSVHMFLWHDGFIWKIILRILLNHIVKNFQVKHGQCDSIISPKRFSFEGSKLLPDFCLAESMIFYFWYVLESIHKFIIELHVLQSLFVRRCIKKQRRCSIISNFTEGDNFSFLMTTKCSWGWPHNVAPLFGPSKEMPSFPLQFAQVA